ncbi:Uncharacterised protein [Bordetella pertussis]|nr:Uncharacterised protein [Bordetella pertussis]
MVHQPHALPVRRDVAAVQAETAGLEMVAAIGQPGLLAGFGVARHLHRQRLREGSQLAGPLDGQRGVADPDQHENRVSTPSQ